VTKKKICWITPDCFTQVDDTVLRHLVKDFKIVWYYICEETLKVQRFGRENARKYAEKYGIELYVVDPKVRNRSLKNYSFYKKLALDINGQEPDLVYYTDRNPYWALVVKFFLRCNIAVLGIHDVMSHTYAFTLSHFLETSTKDLSIKACNHFVTFSPNQHNLLLSVYGKESAVVGMSCKDFGKSDKVLDPIENGVKLLFFGSINEYKGLDLLITALEKIRAEHISNLSLTIAGSGSSWLDCKALIKTKEMYNLLVRFVDNSEIPDLMSTHHFLVLPYRNATQSGPLVTAIAYKLPVIAPCYGCFAETLNNDSAFLYLPGELENTLRKVTGMTQLEYNAMKDACAKVKDANSEETIAQNYIMYFNSLLV